MKNKFIPIFLILCCSIMFGKLAFANNATINSTEIIALVNSVELVNIPDPNLLAVVRDALNKPTGDITVSDMFNLTDLIGENKGISNLTGLEYASNLYNLDLMNNQISVISALAGLTGLERLNLGGNQVADISALANLNNLKTLSLSGNKLTDISVVAGMSKLTQLDFGLNQVSNIAPIAGLSKLEELAFYGNSVAGGDISVVSNKATIRNLNINGINTSDISPVATLSNLETLWATMNKISDLSPLANLRLHDLALQNNQITDISELVNNRSFGAGTNIFLESNPLSTQANADIQTLLSRGVNVVSDTLGVQHGKLQFSTAAYSAFETGSTTNITVSRVDGSSGVVGVTYATSNGTATAGSDYTTQVGTLWFEAEEISKTFTIPISKDTLAESSETVILTLSAATGGATLGTPSHATLTIGDSDVITYPYAEWPAQKDVQVNKIWSIKLNIPVLSSTVTDQKIYVVDSGGQHQKVKVSLAPDTKTIQVTPMENYKLGGSYTLYILKGIASAAPNSIALKSNIRMQFTVAKLDSTISSISDLTNTINQIETYSLPSTVEATMGDGSKKQAVVTWNPSTVDTSKAGTQTFSGSVLGYSGQVKLTLTINATNSTVSKMTSNQIVAPFSPTDIFIFALPDWSNKDDLAVAQKTHATVVGSAHQDNDWRLQKFFDNSELLSKVTGIAHQSGLKYTAQFTSGITNDTFPNESEVAVKDIDGNIIYASMFTETPQVWKSNHYPRWKNYLIDLAKKSVDSGTDIICIDTWTLNHDVVGNKGGDFSENSMSGFRNYLKDKYSVEQLKGFGIDDINTFNYGVYIRNDYLDLYKSEDKWKTPLFKDFLDFQLISSKDFWQDLIEETRKHAEINGKKVLVTVNVPESKHRDMIHGLPIVDLVDGFMSEYHYDLPPYNNSITEYKVFRSLGKPVAYLPNCGDSTELLSRTDLAELMKIYTAEAYASGEFTYAPYAELANSPAGWNLYSADMNKLYPYYDFIANNKSYYDNLVSTAKTAVLYSYASVKNYLPASESFFGISNLLLDSHHQYDVIFAGDNQWIDDILTLDELNQFRVVIMPNVKDISDKQLDLLLTYVKLGGKVLAFGETGSRDESDRPQQRMQLNDLLVEGSHQYGQGQFVYIKDDIGTMYSANRDENIRQQIARTSRVLCKWL